MMGYSASIRVPKGFLNERDKEHRQVALEVERKLVLLSEENSKKYVNLENKKNELGLLNIFESITDDLDYEAVCNLLGSKGILLAQTGSKRSYIWRFGYCSPHKYDDLGIEKKIEIIVRNICKIVLFVGIFTILMELLFSSIYLSVLSDLSAFDYIIQIFKGIPIIMLIKGIIEFIGLILGIYVFRQFISLLVNLRKISRVKLEEVYIKVSFNGETVLSKEQSGLVLE